MKPTYLYRCFDVEGQLLYVGISVDPEHRVRKGHRNASWHHLVSRITLVEYANRRAAERAEVAAIKAEAPLYNVAHTDRWRDCRGKPS